MAWSPPAHNAGIVWVSAPGDYATFNSNHTPDGTERGGRPFSRGHLYTLLSNPIYTGQIAHRGELHPGQRCRSPGTGGTDTQAVTAIGRNVNGVIIEREPLRVVAGGRGGQPTRDFFG